MEFRLLGTFELIAAGRPVNVGPAKQRILLAALTVDTSHPVPVDVLIDRIWDDASPANAPNVLHTYIARARSVLAQAQLPVTLQRRPGGYQLVTDVSAIDLYRFRSLVERTRGLPVRDPRRAELLGEAIALWRGEALSDVAGVWAARLRDGLRQQRLDATADWAEAELALGRHRVVTERLRQLVDDYPLAESLTARLLEALHLAGRDTEALDMYGKARRRIAEELGTEPGPALHDVYQSILRGGRAGPAALPRGLPVTLPAQLPLDILGFAGRRADLARLDNLAARAKAQPTAVVIGGIWGAAGVVRHQRAGADASAGPAERRGRGRTRPPLELRRGAVERILKPG